MTPACEPQEPLIIGFKGSMSSDRCDQVGPDIRARLAEPREPVVFDLNDVDFVGSSFLGLCIYAHRQAGDHGFRLINVCPMVKRVFKIAGLDRILAIE